MKTSTRYSRSLSLIFSLLAAAAPCARAQPAVNAPSVPAITQGNFGAAGAQAFESIGMREARLQDVRMQDVRTSSSGSAVLAIQNGSFEGRAEMASSIKNRLEHDERDFAQMKANVKTERVGPGYLVAMADAQARARRLRASVEAASGSTMETWASARADISADYSAYAAVATRARVLSAAGPSDASASLDAGVTIDFVHTADFRARSQSTASVRSKLAGSVGTIAAFLKRYERSLKGDFKADFKAAIADMTTGEKRLRHSIHAAETAREKDWVVARANLAADYGTYAEAVARAEFVASAEG